MWCLTVFVLFRSYGTSFSSSGVHVYQRMYGCEWDDETGESRGFDQHGYDGQDFIFLDLKELRYITPVLQGIITAQKWNKDREQLELLKQYYEQDCVDWIKYFLMLGKAALVKRGMSPLVSLLQKDSSSPVECHATGFYPSAVTITWLRNGQQHDEDVDLGETLINEDGTFQKTSTLNIYLDDWKKHRYVCVVEHEGKTIQKTEEEIISNKSKLLIVQYIILVDYLLYILPVSPDNWKMNQYFCVEEHKAKTTQKIRDQD
uniref:Ig-like domain-containing protein n=1 Tax=Sinocyclocheilus grahami TaxID=75366 RepID=A0A672Q0J2_SINGR